MAISVLLGPGIKLVATDLNAALKAIFFNYNFLSHHGDVGSRTSNPIIPSFKKVWQFLLKSFVAH
jgi:hypothetical protein